MKRSRSRSRIIGESKFSWSEVSIVASSLEIGDGNGNDNLLQNSELLFFFDNEEDKEKDNELIPKSFVSSC